MRPGLDGATSHGPLGLRERRAAMLAGAALLVWLVSSLWAIGSYRLVEPDEGRNAGAAREVAAGGGWTLPRYDGLPLLDKPPLWFDLAAGAMRAFGPTERAARLPSLLATALTVALVGAFAVRLFGRAAAPAALAIASMPLVTTYAGIAIFDATMSLFVVLALVAGHVAVESRGDDAAKRRSRRSAFVLWLAVLLGVLTKGPVAVALPLVVLLPYALWRRRARALWSLPGCALLVLALAPWLASLEARLPGYLRYVLVTETWGRLSSDELDRAAPAWYFLPFLLGGGAPWSLAALAAWSRRGEEPRGRDPRVVFLLLWLFVPLLFFTVTESKRPHYLLPLLPALALLLAARWREPDAGRRARTAAAATLLGLGALLLVAALLLVPRTRELDPELVEPARLTGAGLAGLFLLAGGLGALWRRSPQRGLLALAAPLLLLPSASVPLVRPLAAERSASGLATLIERRCGGAPVVGVGVLPTSLPFYLGRPVGLASVSGRPFPSTYVERHWSELAARGGGPGEAILSTSLWPPLPPRAVVVIRRSDQGAELAAVGHGFARLGEDHARAAYGRGCAGPDRGGSSSTAERSRAVER